MPSNVHPHLSGTAEARAPLPLPCARVRKMHSYGIHEFPPALTAGFNPLFLEVDGTVLIILPHPWRGVRGTPLIGFVRCSRRPGSLDVPHGSARRHQLVWCAQRRRGASSGIRQHEGDPASRVLQDHPGIADEVRGAVDGWDFKAYILCFLFYRFISEDLA